MIYINELSGTINIPKHTSNEYDVFTLKITSNISDEVILVENGENISTNSLYYKLTLDNLDKVNVGEYTYYLMSNNQTLEKGLLVFGDYHRVVTVNNTFNNRKKQYNG